MDSKKSKVKTVQSVERALAILDVLAEEGSPMKLSSISKNLELNISTVHRLLNTLMVWGYVEQDPYMGKYRLGIKSFEIGNRALYSLDIRSVAKPFLKNLVDKSNETANLAILDEGEVVYIDQVETHNIIKMFASPGTRGPAYCTGSGKVLLASLSDHEINRLAREISFHSYTSSTITSLEKLKQEMTRIREQGYSLDFGEMEEDVRCVAAPLKNHEGRTVAAISLSGPRTRMSNEYILEELVPLVKETAGKISHLLGFDERKMRR